MVKLSPVRSPSSASPALGSHHMPLFSLSGKSSFCHVSDRRHTSDTWHVDLSHLTTYKDEGQGTRDTFAYKIHVQRKVIDKGILEALVKLIQIFKILRS